MTDQFRIKIAQLNPTVGDLQGNAAKAKQAWLQGVEQGSDFVTLPERLGSSMLSFWMPPVLLQVQCAGIPICPMPRTVLISGD